MPIWWSEPTSGHAYILSLVSIVITLIAAIIGIVGYAQLKDSLVLIYGLENVVDFFSSAIVLWRFNNPKTASIDEEQLRQRNEILSKREKRASIGVSIVLAVLGFGGVITAIEDLANGKGGVKDSDATTIFVLSGISFIVFGALAYFKFHYATKLNSPSLRKDGLCSALGSLLSFSMFFNALLAFASEEDFWWWLDPIVALICGIGALGYGLYGMYKAYVKDGYPIFSCKWWMYGSESRNKMQGGHQGAQEIGGGGELELQQPSPSNDSMTANPSLGTKSGIDDFSDVVFT